MNQLLLTLTVITTTLIAGCQSTRLFNQPNFIAYLDQFIGKNKQDVINNINFQAFDINTVTREKNLQSTEYLVYSIHRPLSIPLPMPSPANYSPGMGGMMNGGGMSSPSAQAGNAYEISATCNVIFHLSNDVITQWQTKGRAC